MNLLGGLKSNIQTSIISQAGFALFGSKISLLYWT